MHGTASTSPPVSNRLPDKGRVANTVKGCRPGPVQRSTSTVTLVYKLHRPGTDPRQLATRLRVAAASQALLSPLSVRARTGRRPMALDLAMRGNRCAATRISAMGRGGWIAGPPAPRGTRRADPIRTVGRSGCAGRWMRCGSSPMPPSAARPRPCPTRYGAQALPIGPRRWCTATSTWASSAGGRRLALGADRCRRSRRRRPGVGPRPAGRILGGGPDPRCTTGRRSSTPTETPTGPRCRRATRGRFWSRSPGPRWCRPPHIIRTTSCCWRRARGWLAREEQAAEALLAVVLVAAVTPAGAVVVAAVALLPAVALLAGGGGGGAAWTNRFSI